MSAPADTRVRTTLEREQGYRSRMARCLDLFESFCTVTESVRHGIDVSVKVQPVVVETPRVA
jgi:hypothetical protein